MDAQPGQPGPPAGSARRLSDLLEEFARGIAAERVDLGTIAQSMGRRSIGALLLTFALPMALPIPAPGVSALFGIPLMLFSAELMLGCRRAWLPAWLARRSIAGADLAALIRRGLPILRRIESVVRPRLAWMAGDWAMIPVGAISLLLALAITLPIPLSQVAPSLAIALLALGVIERDGLAVALGVTGGALAIAAIATVSTAAFALLQAWI